MNIDHRLHLYNPADGRTLGYHADVEGYPSDVDRYIERGRSLRSKAAHEGARTAARALRSFLLGRVVEPWKRWRKARSDYRELMALDDRTLRDIGVSRSDIRSIAYGQWDGDADPSTSLVELVVDNPRPARPAAEARAERSAA